MHAQTGLCNNILDIGFEHDNHSLINSNQNNVLYLQILHGYLILSFIFETDP